MGFRGQHGLCPLPSSSVARAVAINQIGCNDEDGAALPVALIPDELDHWFLRWHLNSL
jgi:hypothetical protein